MVTNTNLKYADSSSNYYVIMIVQNLKKNSKSKISNFFAFRATKCRVKANNNREAVVVCARHVVKRPSKRSAIVITKIRINESNKLVLNY